MEESIRMAEDRDKWRKYVHGMAKPRIEDGYSTTERRGQYAVHGETYFPDCHLCNS